MRLASEQPDHQQQLQPQRGVPASFAFLVDVRAGQLAGLVLYNGGHYCTVARDGAGGGWWRFDGLVNGGVGQRERSPTGTYRLGHVLRLPVIAVWQRVSTQVAGFRSGLALEELQRRTVERAAMDTCGAYGS